MARYSSGAQRNRQAAARGYARLIFKVAAAVARRAARAAARLQRKSAVNGSAAVPRGSGKDSVYSASSAEAKARSMYRHKRPIQRRHARSALAARRRFQAQRRRARDLLARGSAQARSGAPRGGAACAARLVMRVATGYAVAICYQWHKATAWCYARRNLQRQRGGCALRCCIRCEAASSASRGGKMACGGEQGAALRRYAQRRRRRAEVGARRQQQ